MGEDQGRSQAEGQRVGRLDLLGEDPGAFPREPLALEAVEDGQSGMGGQAGEKHGGDALTGPGQESDEVRPERFVPDLVFHRIGSRDDQDVGGVSVEFGHRPVPLVDAGGDLFASFDLLHDVEAGLERPGA